MSDDEIYEDYTRNKRSADSILRLAELNGVSVQAIVTIIQRIEAQASI